jgi:squalene-hopene/tetraprenyl-beta-curcumene cyclase
MSFARAAEFLDAAVMTWTKAKDCASCHTTYPYLMARPALGNPDAPVYLHMRKFLEDRVVAGLSEGTEGVTEAVAVAATLAFDDAHQKKAPEPLTYRALNRMWSLQQDDGSWAWNKHLLPPQEDDDYYGAVYAALGVSYMPGNYVRSNAAHIGVTRLKDYLRKTPAPSLHHKTFLLWASIRLDGLMTPAERAQTIEQLRALQRQDGGWNLPSLGDWKRLDGAANDKQASSDGYATGLVVYVLRQAGVSVEDDVIRRAVKWLQTNQRASGRWFTRSLNADRAHYNTVAGTAYAVMALKACDAAEQPTNIPYFPDGGARNKNLRVALSPDGKMVAAIAFEGTLKVFDVTTGKNLAELWGHQQWPTFLRFSPDGKVLAAPDQTVRQFGPSISLWNTTTWRRDKSAQEHRWEGRDHLKIEPKFWDLALGRQVRGLNGGKEYQPSIVASSPDGKILAVAEHFRDGERAIAPRLYVWSQVDDKPWSSNAPGPDGIIEALSWSPDNRTVAVMGLNHVWKDAGPDRAPEFVRYDGQICIWDAKPDDNSQLGRAPRISVAANYAGAGRDMQFSADGKTLITCSSDDGAVLWDVSTLRRTGKLKQIARYPTERPARSTGMALSADGRTLAVANTSNVIQIWRLGGGTAIAPR